MPGTGYSKPVIKFDFTEELGSGPGDPIWVVIRNPRLIPAKEITSNSTSGAYDDDGKIIDRDKAEEATDGLIARLVIAARAYDATVVPEYDDDGNEVPGTGEPVLLPRSHWTAQTAAKLPLRIRARIAEEFTAAQNPPKAPKEGPEAT